MSLTEHMASYGYKRLKDNGIHLEFRKESNGQDHNVKMHPNGKWSHLSTLGPNSPGKPTEGEGLNALKEHLRKVHGSSQHSEVLREVFGKTGKAAGEHSEEDHSKHYDYVIQGAKNRHYGKPTAQQVEDHAKNFHFNNRQSAKINPSYKEFAKAVRKRFEEHHEANLPSEKQRTELKPGDQFSERTQAPMFAPPAVGVVGPTVQFREVTVQFSEDEHHQHVMERMGYKRYKGDSYIHGPTNGQHSVTKGPNGYNFLSSTKHRHNKNDMSKKELYEHLDTVHGGFQSLTRMTPHEAANKKG